MGPGEGGVRSCRWLVTQSSLDACGGVGVAVWTGGAPHVCVSEGSVEWTAAELAEWVDEETPLRDALS